MFSSPPCPSEHRRDPPDSADRASSAAGLAALLCLVAWLGSRPALGPAPGDVLVFPEAVLRLEIVPVPAAEAAVPLSPPSEPEPFIEPEIVADRVESPAPTPPEPEPVKEEPPKDEEIPSPEVQPMIEKPGDTGTLADGIRLRWIAQLRRRIEENKFYPGAARYARETGTVTLHVHISPAAEIERVELVDNTGSALLAESAKAILHRVAATPLDTNRLPEGLRVRVPFAYRMTSR